MLAHHAWELGKRSLRRLAGHVTLAACVAAALPGLAIAAFPGENGKIAFNRDSDIWVTDARGEVQTRLTENDRYETGPSFSPSGNRIAFSRQIGGNLDVFVMDADGTDVTRLTSHPFTDVQPAFSPNGRRIAFASSRDGDYEVYVIGTDGTNLRKLTSRPGNDLDPEFSPLGGRIVLTGQVGQDHPKLFLVDADGTNLRRITSSADSVAEDQPSFAPDGGRIAFDRSDFGQGGLYTVAPDGSSLTQVTSRFSDDQPAFSPDGQRIAFRREVSCGAFFCDYAISVIDSGGGSPTDAAAASDNTIVDWGPKSSAPEPPPADCKGQRATIAGTRSDDLITGTSVRDVAAGLGGDDTVKGLGGNDLLCGARGTDLIRGGRGTDTCRGGRGRDRLRGCER
jgi:Tol biopolymer transport system component